MRNFSSGGTRDNDVGKIDPEGFMSPIVIQRFCEYMDKNRVQADGKIRESDNWQKLFGDNHKDVCIKSAFRHFLDVWLIHRGFVGRDSAQDSICACIFNLNAYLYKLLLEENYGGNKTAGVKRGRKSKTTSARNRNEKTT